MSKVKQQVTPIEEDIIEVLREHWALLADRKQTTFLKEKQNYLERLKHHNSILNQLE